MSSAWWADSRRRAVDCARMCAWSMNTRCSFLPIVCFSTKVFFLHQHGEMQTGKKSSLRQNLLLTIIWRALGIFVCSLNKWRLDPGVKQLGAREVVDVTLSALCELHLPNLMLPSSPHSVTLPPYGRLSTFLTRMPAACEGDVRMSRTVNWFFCVCLWRMAAKNSLHANEVTTNLLVFSWNLKRHEKRRSVIGHFDSRLKLREQRQGETASVSGLYLVGDIYSDPRGSLEDDRDQQAILEAACWWHCAPGGLGLGRSCAGSLGCRAPGPGDPAVSCVSPRTRSRIWGSVTGITTRREIPTAAPTPAFTAGSITGAHLSAPPPPGAVHTAFPTLAAPSRGIQGDMSPSVAGSCWPWSGKTCGPCPSSFARLHTCSSGPPSSTPWSPTSRCGKKSSWKPRRSVSRGNITSARMITASWRASSWRQSPTEQGCSGNSQGHFTLPSPL